VLLKLTALCAHDCHLQAIVGHEFKHVDFDFLKAAKMELKNAVPALVITFISSIILLGSAADLCNQVGSECAGKEVWGQRRPM
jgi:hypothetical protein